MAAADAGAIDRWIQIPAAGQSEDDVETPVPGGEAPACVRSRRLRAGVFDRRCRRPPRSGLDRAEFGRMVDEGFVEPYRGNGGRYRLVDAISGLAPAVAAGRCAPR